MRHILFFLSFFFFSFFSFLFFYIISFRSIHGNRTSFSIHHPPVDVPPCLNKCKYKLRLIQAEAFFRAFSVSLHYHRRPVHICFYVSCGKWCLLCVANKTLWTFLRIWFRSHPGYRVSSRVLFYSHATFYSSFCSFGRLLEQLKR